MTEEEVLRRKVFLLKQLVTVLDKENRELKIQLSTSSS